MSAHEHECSICGEPFTCHDPKCDHKDPVCSNCEWKAYKVEKEPKHIPQPSEKVVLERIELKVSRRFQKLIQEGMELGRYGTNRSEFIRGAIRYYVRYLKGEQEQKNEIEGVVDAIVLKNMKTREILLKAAQDLEGMS